jgi:3-dehydroquinate synthetase
MGVGTLDRSMYARGRLTKIEPVNPASRRRWVVNRLFMNFGHGLGMNAEPRSTRHAESLHEGVAATLRTARALAASGREVDLTGLDNMIGLLCAQILDLPIEQARTFRAPLQVIGEELEHLRQAIAAPA